MNRADEAETLAPGRLPLAAGALHGLIRRDIVSMRLRPGERLSENEVAVRFGTSRTPVREAFIRLADEGLLEVRPQRGTFVSRIDRRAVRRACFTRVALEGAIVRLAASRELPLAHARAIARALGAQSANAGDGEAFTAADDAFHAALARSVDHAEVWDLIDREKTPLERLRVLDVEQITERHVIVAQHHAILDAVTEGDGEGAALLLAQHVGGILDVADQLAVRFPALFQ